MCIMPCNTSYVNIGTKICTRPSTKSHDIEKCHIYWSNPFEEKMSISKGFFSIWSKPSISSGGKKILKYIHYKRRAFWIFTFHQSQGFSLTREYSEAKIDNFLRFSLINFLVITMLQYKNSILFYFAHENIKKNTLQSWVLLHNFRNFNIAIPWVVLFIVA